MEIASSKYLSLLPCNWKADEQKAEGKRLRLSFNEVLGKNTPTAALSDPIPQLFATVA